LDLDGLGLLAEGLGLLLLDELGELVGLLLGLLEALELFDGLGLEDGLALECRASRCADASAAEPCRHGELAGHAGEAKAGAMAKPDTRNDPATRETAIRPARAIAIGTVALRSSVPAMASRAAGKVPCPQASSGVLSVRLGGHVFEHKLADRMTEVGEGIERALRFIMIPIRHGITNVYEMAV